MTLFDYVHQHPVWTFVWACLGLCFVATAGVYVVGAIRAWRGK